jgi:LAS superfamily LD-carboxypeptidase LdcB
MRFSALPGLSRHHWGSDIDVYDAAALPDGYRLQLTLAETQAEGPFAALHRWLDERIAANRSYGFYRPYAVDLGGIAPEPWHLSYAPLAQHYESLLQTPLLYQRLNTEPILLKEYLLTVLPQLLQRYGLAVTPPPWEISRG